MRKLLILAAGLLILGTVALAQRSQSGDKQPPTIPAPQAQGIDPGTPAQPDVIAEAPDQPEYADDQADLGGDDDLSDFSMEAMDAPGMGGAGPQDGGGAWWRPMVNRIRGFMMRQRGNRMDMMRMADRLQLTDAQKDQFKKLRTDFQLASVDRRADLQKAQIKLRELMRDDKSAEADVMKGIDEVARIKTDIAKARFSHMRQMRAVLTDKQLDMLKEMRENRMRPWSGNRAGNGPDSTRTGRNPRPGRGM